MSSCKEVAFQPTLTEVFREHLHHPPKMRYMIIRRKRLPHKAAVLYLKNSPQAVGVRFIGTEETEIVLLGVSRKDVSHHLTQQSCCLETLRSRLLDFNGVFRKVRQVQVYQQFAAVGVWIGPHTPVPLGGVLCQFRNQMSMLIKQFLQMVALHPVFEYLQVFGVGLHLRYRDLVRPEGPLDLDAIHYFWPGPPLWGAQNNRRPVRSL